MRRAALSVHLNIAEGCSRKSQSERRRFFEISRGSVIEVDAAIDVAYSPKIQNEEELKQFGDHLVSTFKQINRFNRITLY
jgi:four helix bundle protein